MNLRTLRRSIQRSNRTITGKRFDFGRRKRTTKNLVNAIQVDRVNLARVERKG